jgi:tetratricopeptide (TPR) repeat protein
MQRVFWTRALGLLGASALGLGPLSVGYADTTPMGAQDESRPASPSRDADRPNVPANTWLEHTRAGRTHLSAGENHEAEIEFLAAFEATQDLPARNVRLKTTLTNLERLADRYVKARDYKGTISLTPRLIAGIEKFRGPADPAIALAWLRLGEALGREDDIAGAEAALVRALELHDAGVSRPASEEAHAALLLAAVYNNQELFDQAETNYLRNLKIVEDGVGTDISLATSLNQLATFYTEHERFELAEPRALQAVEIVDTSSSRSRLFTSMILNTYGLTLSGQGKLEEAEPIFKRALKESRRTRLEVTILRDYAEVLTGLGRTEEAQKMRDRASEIESPGSTRPKTAEVGKAPEPKPATPDTAKLFTATDESAAATASPESEDTDENAAATGDDDIVSNYPEAPEAPERKPAEPDSGGGQDVAATTTAAESEDTDGNANAAAEAEGEDTDESGRATGDDEQGAER